MSIDPPPDDDLTWEALKAVSEGMSPTELMELHDVRPELARRVNELYGWLIELTPGPGGVDLFVPSYDVWQKLRRFRDAERASAIRPRYDRPPLRPLSGRPRRRPRCRKASDRACRLKKRRSG
jgi:hypothetical protein